MSDVSPGMPTSRRQFLTGSARLAAGAGLASIIAIEPAGATPQALQGAIAEVVGEATLRRGKVTLSVPPLVENGNTVPLTVSVDSPMTEADHVKSIHIFNEKNGLAAMAGESSARNTSSSL